MLIHAHAKINLCLDVTGVRPNGYHDVRMIMQSVALYDELEITENNSNDIRCYCDNTDIICDDSNLIVKAAKAIREAASDNRGVDIRLTKNIPIAAGMAGGSTDAAGTLVGINRLLGYGFSNDKLREIGVKLGADIPFCIEGGTFLSEGIGEILSPLPPCPDCFLVIAKPDISVSTKEVYDRLILDDTTKHPQVDAMIDCIKSDDLKGICGLMSNLLADVTEDMHPIIEDIKQSLLNDGAMGALMSGSGPTVFGIFDDKKKAETALESLHNKLSFKQGFVTVPARSGIAIV